jgi:hypothetical protein
MAMVDQTELSSTMMATLDQKTPSCCRTGAPTPAWNKGSILEFPVWGKALK